MEDMDGQRPVTADEKLTVGQVAERFGVTVRTLHHYDDVGLLRPSERSAGGYRLYTEDDLLRLRHVVVYRRLGFPLERIEELLAAADPDSVLVHLRRQRESVLARQAELADLVTAIDRALEKDMTGIDLTPEERRELFGDGFSDEYAAEAGHRWGDAGKWNLEENDGSGRDVRLRNTLSGVEDSVQPVAFPYFGGDAPHDFVATAHDDVLLRNLPVKQLSFADGSTATLSLKATVNVGTATSTITNCASLLTSTPGDVNSGNNSGCATVTVLPPASGAARMPFWLSANRQSLTVSLPPC